MAHKNIPQIKAEIETTMLSNDEMLLGKIRVVGLREKIKSRQLTLKRALDVLNSHKE